MPLIVAYGERGCTRPLELHVFRQILTENLRNIGDEPHYYISNCFYLSFTLPSTMILVLSW
jgi:hypothetical protein